MGSLTLQLRGSNSATLRQRGTQRSIAKIRVTQAIRLIQTAATPSFKAGSNKGRVKITFQSHKLAKRPNQSASIRRIVLLKHTAIGGEARLTTHNRQAMPVLVFP